MEITYFVLIIYVSLSHKSLIYDLNFSNLLIIKFKDLNILIIYIIL